MVHVAPMATAAPETQVPPLVIENVPPAVPTLAIVGFALRTSSEVEVAGLVTVMVAVLVVVLAVVVVNAGVGPENVTAAASAASVPFNVEVCVPAKSVIDIVAGFAPNGCVVSGLNCISILQVAPEASVVMATS